MLPPSRYVNIVKEGSRRGYNIDEPYTAESFTLNQGQKFFQFVQQLHRNLPLAL